MDDLPVFERRLASELDRMAGPGRRIDAVAVARAAASQSHKWRFRAMFSATRFVAAAAIVALFGGFAMVGVVSIRQTDQLAPGAASPSPTTTESLLQGLVTEEVAPGVERIISDGAGHDLDETHPTYRYDMDNIFILPDGTIWISTTYHGDDGDANAPGVGAMTWVLGQPGLVQQPPGSITCHPETGGYGVDCFNPVTFKETYYLMDTRIAAVAVAPDGTVWALGDYAGGPGGLYRITPRE